MVTKYGLSQFRCKSKGFFTCFIIHRAKREVTNKTAYLKHLKQGQVKLAYYLQYVTIQDNATETAGIC